MRRKLYFPPEVRNAIQVHVQQKMSEFHEKYDSAVADEDTMTGQFGVLLSSGERRTVADGQNWTWKIDYAKLGGRGKRAAESFVGADGILEIRVNGVQVEGRKSALFQAKFGEPRGKDALTQAIRLSTWREASLFLSYSEDVVVARTIDEVLQGTSSTRASLGMPFPDFFNNVFLECALGDSDLLYDARARTLSWRDEAGQYIRVPFPVKHRIRTSIKSPYTSEPAYHLISPEQIIDHRMDSTLEERLGLPQGFSLSELKKQQKVIRHAFHPDKLQRMLDQTEIAILNRRTGEFGEAYSQLRKSGRRPSS